jgi:hypothetical protein
VAALRGCNPQKGNEMKIIFRYPYNVVILQALIGWVIFFLIFDSLSWPTSYLWWVSGYLLGGSIGIMLGTEFRDKGEDS